MDSPYASERRRRKAAIERGRARRVNLPTGRCQIERRSNVADVAAGRAQSVWVPFYSKRDTPTELDFHPLTEGRKVTFGQILTEDDGSKIQSAALSATNLTLSAGS